MIQVKNLAFGYPRSHFRLEVPSLAFAPSEKTALVGPSGCGKTTLLNLMGGILVPGAGTVRVGDLSLGDLSDAARRHFRITQVGFVFQDFGLVEYLNVLDNILLPCFVHAGRALDADVRARARALVADVGLAEREAARVSTLSHGEKQRVAICRAVLNNPPYMLADEPTGNLDRDNTAHILDLLFAQADSTNATLVVVTHDHTLLERFDRVVDLARPDGRIP